MQNKDQMAIPNHIGFIMDGNRRWARENNQNYLTAYQKGADVLQNSVEQAKKWGVKFVTAFAFSHENWNRPKNELEILMTLFDRYLTEKIKIFHEKNVKFNVIGRIKNFSENLQQKIQNLLALTKNNNGITLTLALSYGGKVEIIDAINKIPKNSLSTEIALEDFEKNLYDPNLPPVDLIIRTSGEERTSGFMLWESDYAELYFLKKNWPEVVPEDIDLAIKDFSQRKRNFGA
ncbi:MAG: di-trans,poly-cis-decaprenylcistransferase [Candidatus Kerfeldbacteria bacterium CG08_land_8_20_14_0_20_43_14]|uniref:Isoprenyl transferase n=1 Tax=Candidatus Kerfeldbacteria bacterium CG08_land_8_20_14_0_20_43_14 TaxID=2014246 RepID=A0A2H0YQW7_9BACT|nr:MAG: di-trans,poly-cis-decaprenylcistransferase [Candidatus Kerfeldbacteria bacterium CG08_land_8_20_14_0_20_43_14]